MNRVGSIVQAAYRPMPKRSSEKNDHAQDPKKSTLKKITGEKTTGYFHSWAKKPVRLSSST
jgi:hypothetical protein